MIKRSSRVQVNRNLEDRYYSDDEFNRCAVKLKHNDWMSAVLHTRRLRRERPLASIKIYECDFCDGLHITSGRSDKNYDKLVRSLAQLEKRMANPGYAEKAPKYIQSKQAQTVRDLQHRISVLEVKYKIRKAS